MGQLEVKLLPEVEGLDVSPQEARELWSFLDGSIMNVDTRHHLWKAWGLCPRHNWSYATMEIEQRGGLPFSTTILFEDLTGRAARLLQRTALLPWALVVGRLDAKASCYSCDHAARPSALGPKIVGGPPEPTPGAVPGRCSTNRRSSGRGGPVRLAWAARVRSAGCICLPASHRRIAKSWLNRSAIWHEGYGDSPIR